MNAFLRPADEPADRNPGRAQGGMGRVRALADHAFHLALGAGIALLALIVMIFAATIGVVLALLFVFGRRFGLRGRGRAAAETVKILEARRTPEGWVADQTPPR